MSFKPILLIDGQMEKTARKTVVVAWSPACVLGTRNECDRQDSTHRQVRTTMRYWRKVVWSKRTPR